MISLRFNELTIVAILFQVTSVDHKVDTLELIIEHSNTTGTYLQDINDDCLQEIFLMDSITLMDLCSIAETCTHFREIADGVFLKKFAFYVWESSLGTSANDVKRILIHFGSLISKFGILQSPEDEDMTTATCITNLVTRYCINTLESLHIDGYEIPEVTTVKLKPLFKHLERCTMSNVTINGNGKELFANCESMNYLNIQFLNNPADILLNVFPKLEMFTYKSYGCDDEYLLAIFISRNKSLKGLAIYRGDLLKTSILEVIGDSCKGLTVLSIEITLANEKAFKSLQALDQLKQLAIYADYKNITNLIQQIQPLKSLEFLDLSNVIGDSEFIAALLQLKNLRQLYLVDIIELNNFDALGSLVDLTTLSIRYEDEIGNVDCNIVDMIKRLIHLDTLEIYTDAFILDKKTFSKIVKIVKGRSKMLELYCQIDFVYEYDENENVRLEKLQ